MKTHTFVIVATGAICLLAGLLASGQPATQPNASAKKARQVIVCTSQAADIGADVATHEEDEVLNIKFKRLSALCLQIDGNLLACDASTSEIKVINPAGKLVKTIKPGVSVEAIDVAKDGTIYCGGKGKLVKLDKTGKVLATADIPNDAVSETSRRRKRRSRRTKISGIAVSDKDLFVTVGSGSSMSARANLFRFDLNLENPKKLAERLRGCCQRCDIVFKDGVLYLAENAVHRVVRYDREGKVLGKWGKSSRRDLRGFGSCCNPMNLCFGSSGMLYTAESGMGRIKKYTIKGEFKKLVGHVRVKRFTRAGGLAASCSNIAIAVTPDAKRVYVMDYKKNIIRVLREKKTKTDKKKSLRNSKSEVVKEKKGPR